MFNRNDRSSSRGRGHDRGHGRGRRRGNRQISALRRPYRYELRAGGRRLHRHELQKITFIWAQLSQNARHELISLLAGTLGGTLGRTEVRNQGNGTSTVHPGDNTSEDLELYHVKNEEP